MLFQIYGETALYQLLGFVLVFTGLCWPTSSPAAPRPAVSSAFWCCPLR